MTNVLVVFVETVPDGISDDAIDAAIHKVAEEACEAKGRVLIGSPYCVDEDHRSYRYEALTRPINETEESC